MSNKLHAAFKVLVIALSIIGIVLIAMTQYSLEQARLAQAAAERRLQENNDWIEKTYITRSGYEKPYGSFVILSLDQGKTWYRKQSNTDGTVTLIEANDLGHQQLALERLFNHAHAGKTIDSTTTEGRKMLEDAGFTVTDAEANRKKP